MVDPDTFLTTWSVMVDECCPSQLPPAIHPGPRASLSRREVVTLGLFGQWAGFRGERAFDRYAHQYLRTAFPTLPPRSPLKRLRRRHHAAIVACFLPLGDRLAGRQGPHPRGWGVGQPALGPYGCDQGFEGPAAPARWWPS
jgi:hypothetical protein